MNASISPNKRILFTVLWSQSQNNDILNDNEVENEFPPKKKPHWNPMTMTKASNADKKRQRRNDIEMNELANEPTSEQLRNECKWNKRV